jgi:DNA polymerase-3 subunit epsilon
VEQHLRNTSTEKGLRMLQEITRVDFELTGSEIIALLRESNLVKHHKPRYNRALKKSAFKYGIYDEVELDGYLRLNVKLISRSNTFPIIQFTSKKEAGDFLCYLREKFNLCEKYCGTSIVTNSCFQHQVKECKGACLLEEDSNVYNRRVQQAIDQLTFESKSFFILDKGRDKFEKSLVFIENGIFKGFGFAPYHFNYLDKSNWVKFIQPQVENRDDKYIINQALFRKPDLKIIEI